MRTIGPNVLAHGLSGLIFNPLQAQVKNSYDKLLPLLLRGNNSSSWQSKKAVDMEGCVDTLTDEVLTLFRGGEKVSYKVAFDKLERLLKLTTFLVVYSGREGGHVYEKLNGVCEAIKEARLGGLAQVPRLSASPDGLLRVAVPKIACGLRALSASLRGVGEEASAHSLLSEGISELRRGLHSYQTRRLTTELLASLAMIKTSKNDIILRRSKIFSSSLKLQSKRTVPKL